MKKPELLLPGGSIEKCEYAIRYGADAVYFGTVDFSLRALRKGELITDDNMKECVDLVHSLGAKAYLTLNIYSFNSDIEKGKRYTRAICIVGNEWVKCLHDYFCSKLIISKSERGDREPSVKHDVFKMRKSGNRTVKRSVTEASEVCFEILACQVSDKVTSQKL